MLPAPIRPSVLPVISEPMNFDFSHLPARVDASAAGNCRATANIIAMACSAVVIELPKGVFITTIPLPLAAPISTLSTPIPARPITLSRFALAIRSAVALVAERIARPSYSPMIAASFSGSFPSLGWKSTSTPRSRKICTAASDNSSEMSTLGMSCSSWRTLGSALEFRMSGGLSARGGGKDQPALAVANAQSSHGVSAATSAVSTVAPHQIRSPGGASR